MRLVTDSHRGRIGFVPMPLEICPGRQIWEGHRESEYIVFFDESFYRFFGFEAADGNFCHAAVGVPTNNYLRLQELLAPTVQAYVGYARRLYRDDPGEIKFTVLRSLPMRFRLSVARELVRALAATGGFVAGFYSPTRGIVMERVRANLLGSATEVPDEHGALYDAARAELSAQFQGVGQSELISRLLMIPFSAIFTLLGSFECHFRVRYDPRQEDEDRAVRTELANYMGLLVRAPELFGEHNRFLGMEADVSSHDDLGLQLADVVAGEVRDFFRTNPEALTESSTLRLITPESHEPLQKFIEIHGRFVKNGALSGMSRDLARKLVRKNSANPISYYYPVLAAGILTCVADTGQRRDLELPTRMISDAVD